MAQDNILNDIKNTTVGVGRGATAGLTKYPAAALLMAARKYGDGSSMSWQEALDAVQNEYQQMEAESPKASLGGEIVGALVPGAAIAKGARAAQLSAKALTGANEFGNVARVGTSIGGNAAYGGVNAASNNEDVGTGTLVGGFLGGLGEGVGAVVKKGGKILEEAQNSRLADIVKPYLVKAANSRQQAAEALAVKGLDPSKLTEKELDYIVRVMKNNKEGWIADLTPRELEYLKPEVVHQLPFDPANLPKKARPFTPYEPTPSDLYDSMKAAGYTAAGLGTNEALQDYGVDPTFSKIAGLAVGGPGALKTTAKFMKRAVKPVAGDLVRPVKDLATERLSTAEQDRLYNLWHPDWVNKAVTEANELSPNLTTLEKTTGLTSTGLQQTQNMSRWDELRNRLRGTLDNE